MLTFPLRVLLLTFPHPFSLGEWRIVEGLNISQFSREKLSITTRELLEEKLMALEYLEKNSK